MWVADSSEDIEDQFIRSASAICWDQFLRCPRCLNTAWKCHRPLLALDIPWHPRRIVALESRGFTISSYLPVWIRQSLVWIRSVISDIQWASKCLYMPIEETDCNTSGFMKTYEVIRHEATANGLPPCEIIIGSTVSFAFVVSALRHSLATWREIYKARKGVHFSSLLNAAIFSQYGALEAILMFIWVFYYL